MTQNPPVRSLQAAWLLLRLQLIRFVNQIAFGFGRFQRRKKAPQRTATSGKRKQALIIGGLVAISMAFSFINLSYQALSNMRERLGSVVVQNAPAAKTPVLKQASRTAQPIKREIRVPLPPAAGFTLPPGVIKAATLETVLLLLALTLLSIGGRDLGQTDWDLEWLATLPVAFSTLVTTRILQRTIVNLTGLYALWPFLSVVAWISGYGIASPLLALAAALPLLAVAATLRTIADTGLRLRLSPPQLRNLQAILAVTAVIVLYLAISPGMPAKSNYVSDWAVQMPGWVAWLPPGLAIQSVTSVTPTFTIQLFAALAAETAAFVGLGVLLLMWQLRAGVVAGGARETGRLQQIRKQTAATDGGDRWILTPIQARELRLLGRDRSFLVQTLFMPVVIIGAQIFFNSSGAGLLALGSGHPEHLAAIAFVIPAYALMFSAFQTLNSEGQALWILYSVPYSLESILRQKAALWGIASFLYPLAIFGFAISTEGTLSPSMVELLVMVLAGVPIFAVIATSLGVFACDPLAQEVQRRIRPSYAYLYMLLCSTYVYGIYASNFWQRAPLIVLTALLAFALWQKARDQLPYLLDPAASPPARVSVSDGLVAALLFFVLQALVAILAMQDDQRLSGRIVLIAFSVAGAVTFAIIRLSFWYLKSEGVPRTFGRGAGYAVTFGIAGGAAAAVGALIYLVLLKNTPFFERVHETVLTGQEDIFLISILAVVAAPIFEEFIFRGLIFGGLRRSVGIGASVLASAAIFAIIHPPVSVIPVFGLGVAAALVYERTKLLIGPMTAHAFYNAAVIAFQFVL